jgi:hypothetical protein
MLKHWIVIVGSRLSFRWNNMNWNSLNNTTGQYKMQE